MPSSKNYVRDIEQEYKTQGATPAAKKKRAAQNKARRMLTKEGLVHKGDGKDVDHKQALSKGGKNTRSNLRVVDANDNRSYPRNKDGSMKKNV